MTTIRFEFRNQSYPIKITYWDAIEVYPDKFGINLCEVFTDEDAALETMQKLTLDDLCIINMVEHFTEIDRTTLLKSITSEDLDRFREDFWAAVSVFSGPLKRGILQQMWTQFKREIKNAELQERLLDKPLSDSNPVESKSDTEH